MVNSDIEAGFHSVQLNANSLASDVCICRMQAGFREDPQAFAGQMKSDRKVLAPDACSGGASSLPGPRMMAGSELAFSQFDGNIASERRAVDFPTIGAAGVSASLSRR